MSSSKKTIKTIQRQVSVRSPYTFKEWQSIEKLASVKGKMFTATRDIKEHIKSL